MRILIRSGFFWRFVGGFALGAVGLATLHPATATPVASAPVVR